MGLGKPYVTYRASIWANPSFPCRGAERVAGLPILYSQGLWTKVSRALSCCLWLLSPVLRSWARHFLSPQL